MRIDLNCDMGESYGAWSMGSDREILPFVTSANIACGYHAGDPRTIRETVEAAIENNVAIGAHPSYPDLAGFGRRSMDLSPDEVYDTVLYQISAVNGFCRAGGAKMRHVKPHGALYNCAADDYLIAEAIASAVRDLDSSLILYGLSGSELINAASNIGLRFAEEVFADRTYNEFGRLTPRTESNALIESNTAAIEQVVKMVSGGEVISTSGNAVSISADTVCIHGDGKNAVTFAEVIRKRLDAMNVIVAPPHSDSQETSNAG